MINRVAPKGSCVPAAVELANVVCEGAPLAVRYSKAVARASYSMGEELAAAELRDLRRTIFKSDDFREGPRAFAEKRTAAGLEPHTRAMTVGTWYEVSSRLHPARPCRSWCSECSCIACGELVEHAAGDEVVDRRVVEPEQVPADLAGVLAVVRRRV